MIGKYTDAMRKKTLVESLGDLADIILTAHKSLTWAEKKEETTLLLTDIMQAYEDIKKTARQL